MHIGGARRQVPLVLTGNAQVIGRFGVGSNVDVAKAAGFFNGFLRPDTGFDIVGSAILRQQVQRNFGELLARTTLQEQHLVVGGNGHQVAQVLLGLLGNGHVVVATVTHLHHGQTLAIPVQHFGLGALQDSVGKRSRACAEVKGSFAHIHSRSAHDVRGASRAARRLHRAGYPTRVTLLYRLFLRRLFVASGLGLW
ncbi:hypothetical protein D3C78_1104990 [compost metagenome]